MVFRLRFYSLAACILTCTASLLVEVEASCPFLIFFRFQHTAGDTALDARAAGSPFCADLFSSRVVSLPQFLKQDDGFALLKHGAPIPRHVHTCSSIRIPAASDLNQFPFFCILVVLAVVSSATKKGITRNFEKYCARNARPTLTGRTWRHPSPCPRPRRITC